MKAVWIRRSLWLAGFGCLLLPVFDDPPLHSGAYVQDVGVDRASVAMITRAATSRSLEVVDAGPEVKVTQGTEPSRRHTFQLEGLQPAREYRYRIVDANGAECDAGLVRTAPADDRAKVRFAVVGDSGGQPWWIWGQRSALLQLPARWDWLPPSTTVTRIGARVAAATPDFVLHVGDVVYPWGQQGHYATGFFRPFAEALRRAPFYVALGNHDIVDDAGRQALANFVLPRSPETGDERCYSFAWGAVRVTVLDLADREDVKPGHPALEALRAQLATATEPWQVVTSHYPIHSASRQRDRLDLNVHLLPMLEQWGVDLYLCGHDHTYQRFGVDGGLVQVVSGGGGKSLYEVRRDPRAQVVLSCYHWCIVEVVEGAMTLRALGTEGELLDTVTFRGNHVGERLERIRAASPARARRIEALR